MKQKFFTISDLCKRWIYSKAGIHKLTKSKNFPEPFAVVSNGKIKIFSEEDIIEYEKNKKWLFDENEKLRRQKLFFLLSEAKKANDEERQKILNHCFNSPMEK